MILQKTKNMSMNLPPEDRESFRIGIQSYLDITEIEKVSYKLLVKYFTAAELEALAD